MHFPCFLWWAAFELKKSVGSIVSSSVDGFLIFCGISGEREKVPFVALCQEKVLSNKVVGCISKKIEFLFHISRSPEAILYGIRRPDPFLGTLPIFIQHLASHLPI